MTPRTILCTGKGGVGKTSVAAATARRAAAAGARTLVLSTDPAHSLADALQEELGPRPRRVADRLAAQQVSAQAEVERHWGAMRAWLGDVLAERGLERLTAEELAVPPGLDEVLALLELEREHRSGDFDVIVVDCAPTGETLRLLGLPDVARWWTERVAPQGGRLVEAARPVARAMLDLRLPGERALDELARLAERLVGLSDLLRAPGTSVRLVMTPDRMVLDETRRTFTLLNLFGFLTDAVVVNRVFPPEVGGYFGAWRERQQALCAEVETDFAPVPVVRAPFFGEEVVGPAMLDRLGAALFAGHDPVAVLHDRVTQRLALEGARAHLRVELPFAQRGDLALRKVGEELVVRLGDHKRSLRLPPALADYAARSASLEDGVLHVIFDAPDRPG